MATVTRVVRQDGTSYLIHECVEKWCCFNCGTKVGSCGYPSPIMTSYPMAANREHVVVYACGGCFTAANHRYDQH